MWGNRLGAIDLDLIVVLRADRCGQQEKSARPSAGMLARKKNETGSLRGSGMGMFL
jgi:hypothetical protein